jgi:hypothetical protein
MKLTTPLYITLLAAFALLITGCGGSSEVLPAASNPGYGAPPPTGTDTSNRIYIVAGGSGSAVSSAQPNTFTITLDALDPGVDWYTDRPERTAGEEATDQFVNATWNKTYAAMRPNALLQYKNSSGLHALFGSVGEQQFDAKTGRMTFSLILSKPSYDISGGIGAFTHPVLTILNNLTPPAVGSSFALDANKSRVEADGNGGFRLVMSDVDDGVFWMNNAPARAGDFESFGSFANNWDERFGIVAPNASLAGEVDDGTYKIVLLTLSEPTHDVSAHTISFKAVPLLDASTAHSLDSAFLETILYIDAGARNTPDAVFSQAWRGFAYSPVPGTFIKAPTGAFYDSDMTADNFQAIWGSKDSCGRDDLQKMAAAGVNVIRLYDYNYARGSTTPGVAGKGHIAFLDEAQSLGIKVIIPVSNWNFSNEKYAWENINNTVKQIVESVKKNGAIHPAVHSFSVGNELDLNQYNLGTTTLITRAVQVVNQLHTLVPDHFITIPISNADEKRFYAMFKNGEGAIPGIPADVYSSRFYNSVQTFKLGGGDLENNILKAYDAGGYGVPLMITELGRSRIDAGSNDNKVDQVIGQAQAVRTYMDATPSSLVKGFCIFQWQNANWKRDGSPSDVPDSTYGINNYDGTLCTSTTGKYMSASGMADSVSYNVDKLSPLTNATHPEGLLQSLSQYFK